MTFTALRRAVANGLPAALLLAAALAASAQIPGLPPFGQDRAKPVPAQPAPQKSEAPNDPNSRVDKLLADVRADRDYQPPPPPEGVTDDEVAAQRNAIATLLHLYDRRTYATAELARLRKAHADAEAADRAWKGLAEPPPYSILDVDEWRDAAELLRAHIAVLGAAIRHLDGELERAQAETHRADEALRRANDARDAPFGDARREREAWRRDLAELQLRAAGAGAHLTQLARDAQGRGPRRAAGGAPPSRTADRDRDAAHALRCVGPRARRSAG